MLRIGHVDARHRCIVHRAPANVADDADDGDERGDVGGGAETERLPDRILRAEQLPDEFLVDDRDRGTTGTVGGTEVPSGAKRQPERVKIPWCDGFKTAADG